MQTVRVTYIGPEAEVDVPDARAVVKHGASIEVPGELAAGLLCQDTNWKKSTATKSAPAAGKE